MNKKNKVIYKPALNYFLLYSITIVLFLLFIILNIILFEIFQKYNPKLEINRNSSKGTSNSRYLDLNENNDSSTDISDKDKNKSEDFNPFYYLFGFYIIFIMMSIYMIWIINRSQIKEEYEKQIKSDLLKFLYFANNGSLIVSLIFLSSVFKASGFLPFGIGLIVLGIGTFYYVKKIKITCKDIFSGDEINNKIKSLVKIPCTIINIIQFTYECCRCQYYNIKTTTYYTDGTKETSYCCTSICCLFWNIYWLVVKILTTFFMIIAYYIFLGIFWIFWILAKLIYDKCKKNEKYKEEDKVSHGTNINGANNNNPPGIIVNNLPTETSFIKNNEIKEKDDNSNSNKIESNIKENININNIINDAGGENKNNNNINNPNIIEGNKINNNINLENNANDFEKVNSENPALNCNSTDRFVNQMEFNDNNNIKETV